MNRIKGGRVGAYPQPFGEKNLPPGGGPPIPLGGKGGAPPPGGKGGRADQR